MSIQVNDVYEPVTEDAIISAFSRVLWVGHNEGVIAFIDISSSLAKKPFLVGSDEFKKSVQFGDVKLAKIKVPQYILVLDTYYTKQISLATVAQMAAIRSRCAWYIRERS